MTLLNNYHAQDIKSLLSARADNRTSAGTFPYRRHRPGMINAGGASTMSYSDWAFGFSISGAVVTVNSGMLRHGTRTPMAPFEVASTDVAIAEDHSWIYVSYTFGSGEITINQSVIEPQNTEEIFNQPLHKWRLISGAASLETICHLGDITIPGSFA